MSFFLSCIAFLLFLVPTSLVDALVLDMQINVIPEESMQLEKSFSEIHSFFSNKKGFIEASLEKVNSNTYKLQEEWDQLTDYEEAINTIEFKELAANVPGSSNWSANDFYKP